MDIRITIFLCIVIAMVVSALPSAEQQLREKRDVMESMKHAWGEVVRTLSEAGDAVVHVFKPTEKSIINKMTDGVKDLTN